MSKVLTSDINKFRKGDLVFARESVGVVTSVGVVPEEVEEILASCCLDRMMVRIRLTNGFEFPVTHQSALWSQIKVLAKA